MVRSSLQNGHFTGFRLALLKCKFGDTVGEAIRSAFLCRLLPCEDKLSAVQMDIGQVWDPKYNCYLDRTNTVPIQAKLPHLHPKNEAWLDIHLDEPVAKGVIGPIPPGMSHSVLCCCF